MKLVEPPPPAPQRLLQDGYVLQQCVVLGLLGFGSFAQVYKTRHRYTEQLFADKVLEPSRTTTKKTVDALIQEAKILAHLCTPHVARVFDIGSTPEGFIFMRMELLVGKTLFECRRAIGRLSIPFALRLFAQLCSALAEAHAQGLIHRDIKPKNLIVEGRERRGNAWLTVLDFGIAKVFGSAVDTTDRMHTVRGTMRYLPPEALYGDNEAPSWRYDIWAAGIVLWEMLADRHPREELLDDPRRYGPAIASREMPDIREIVPGCPSYVVELLEGALGSDPQSRRTARELGMAAEAALLKYGEEVAAGEHWFEPSVRETELFLFTPGETAVDPKLWMPQAAPIPRYEHSLAEELMASRASQPSYEPGVSAQAPESARPISPNPARAPAARPMAPPAPFVHAARPIARPRPRLEAVGGQKAARSRFSVALFVAMAIAATVFGGAVFYFASVRPRLAPSTGAMPEPAAPSTTAAPFAAPSATAVPSATSARPPVAPLPPPFPDPSPSAGLAVPAVAASTPSMPSAPVVPSPAGPSPAPPSSPSPMHGAAKAPRPLTMAPSF